MELVKEAVAALPESAKSAPELQNLVFYKGKGCEVCDGIGYKGRVGLYEVLEMKDNLRELILKKGTPREIEKMAILNGMTTLEQSGILKALKGLTTLEEVYRVSKHGES